MRKTSINRILPILGILSISRLYAMDNNGLVPLTAKTVGSCIAGTVTNYIAIRLIDSQVKASAGTAVGLTHAALGQKYVNTAYGLGCQIPTMANLIAIDRRHAAIKKAKAERKKERQLKKEDEPTLDEFLETLWKRADADRKYVAKINHRLRRVERSQKHLEQRLATMMQPKINHTSGDDVVNYDDNHNDTFPLSVIVNRGAGNRYSHQADSSSEEGENDTEHIMYSPKNNLTEQETVSYGNSHSVGIINENQEDT